MEIIYLNHSSFLIKTKLQGNKIIKILLDPFSKEIGPDFKSTEADIVLISHDHPDHNNLAGVKGLDLNTVGDESLGSKGLGPYIITKAGQYEVGGIHIKGISSYHDNKKGEERGKNIIYTIFSEGYRVCFLGDLGHNLTDNQVEAIGDINTLLIPVGGIYTIDPETASEVIGQIEPSFAIPMHYKTSSHKEELTLKPLEEFTKQMGESDLKTKDSFEPHESLSDETEIIVLKPTYS
ncbi:MBL fold metallo-hydrolase [bacterium]|nr:MBL fold metallo-hydrolase [bacterium]